MKNLMRKSHNDSEDYLLKKLVKSIRQKQCIIYVYIWHQQETNILNNWYENRFFENNYLNLCMPLIFVGRLKRFVYFLNKVFQRSTDFLKKLTLVLN